jgi:hypothetical protein
MISSGHDVHNRPNQSLLQRIGDYAKCREQEARRLFGSLVSGSGFSFGTLLFLAEALTRVIVRLASSLVNETLREHR